MPPLLRHSLRTLTRRPLLSATIVATLMVGIGATTATYTVVDGILLRPLPYDEPDRLVMVWEHNLQRDNRENVVSPANFLAWRESVRSIEPMAALTQIGATMTGAGEAERVGVTLANASFFRITGARPAVGRLFAEEEDVDGRDDVAVLSYEFWQSRFGGDPDLVGTTLTLNGETLTVVGVLEQGFHFPLSFTFGWTGPQQVWVPQGFPETAAEWGGRFLQVVGRLAPGATLEEARAEMGTVAAGLLEAFPDRQAGWDVNVVALRSQILGGVERGLYLVLAAVGLVLLIACANVANLMLNWSQGRRRELAVRSSLGAGWWGLARQVLTESLLLAFLGGVAGVVLAYWAVQALVALGPDLPRLGSVGLNGTVLAVTAAVITGAGLLFGAFPVIAARRMDPAQALRSGDVRTGETRALRRVRSGLVVVEIALSLVLLASAGLLLRSFTNLSRTGVGFATERILTARVELAGGYDDDGARAAFFDRLMERVEGMPGVSAATASSFAPLGDAGSATSYWPGDRPEPEPGEASGADIRPVQRGYHEAMGISVLAGRSFDARDGAGAPLRAVVNRSLAEAEWPGRNPVGQVVVVSWDEPMRAEIIGVVDDVRHAGPATPPRQKIYFDYRQFDDFGAMTVLLRTQGDPMGLVPGLRAAVRELDPGVPVAEVETMDQRLARVTVRTRFALFTLGFFAAAALVLALIGVYGVLAYTVGRRTREFGLRLALGSSPRALILHVLREGLATTVLAVAIGLGGAALAGRLLQGLVYDVDPLDPATLAAAAAVIAATALSAAYLPARRASRTDPGTTLRME
jgi:putative ABC transport system permease protein